VAGVTTVVTQGTVSEQETDTRPDTTCSGFVLDVSIGGRTQTISDSDQRTVAAFCSVSLSEAMTYMLFYPLFRLVFGTLYPAYASYKAVRTKNVKEYVSRVSVCFFSLPEQLSSGFSDN
jgi:hypothetical protein